MNINTMNFKCFLLLSLIITGCGSVSTPEEKQQQVLISEDYSVQDINIDDLLSWKFYGLGQVSKVQNQLQMSESEGSLGVMLVSPRKHGRDIIVSYDIMTLRPATVLVALMSVNNDGDGGLNLEEEYNANMKYLIDSVNLSECP